MSNRICTICARGGSKGVPGKNIRLLNGKPLLAYSIEQAKATQLFEVIAVSSDSDDILNCAKDWGVTHLVKRPNELATDTAGKLPVIQHCVSEIQTRLNKTFKTMIDLDCTSPLRKIEDINGVVTLVEEGLCSNVITGMSSRRSPYFNLVEETAKGFVTLSKKLPSSIVRRQDAPVCYDMNASIYGWTKEAFFQLTKVISDQTRLFLMPEERSIDIDSELDFEFVEYVLKKRQGV